MRISDWSSDVCSSDLKALTLLAATAAFGVAGALAWSLSSADRNDAPSERVGVSARHGAEVLSDAPKDYGDLALRAAAGIGAPGTTRSEEHTSELQSLMRISYAVFCLKKKNKIQPAE